jgi:hypothetical protein
MRVAKKRVHIYSKRVRFTPLFFRRIGNMIFKTKTNNI